MFNPPTKHVRRKISAGVDGGLSGGSSMPRPGSEDPIGASRNFRYILAQDTLQEGISYKLGPSIVNM